MANHQLCTTPACGLKDALYVLTMHMQPQGADTAVEQLAKSATFAAAVAAQDVSSAANAAAQLLCQSASQVLALTSTDRVLLTHARHTGAGGDAPPPSRGVWCVVQVGHWGEELMPLVHLCTSLYHIIISYVLCCYECICTCTLMGYSS